MHKVIRVDVVIENNQESCINMTTTIYDIMFSEHTSHMIDTKEMLDRLSRVMKKMKNWSMITIQATSKNKNDYTPARG